jgi:hypothetical protein
MWNGLCVQHLCHGPNRHSHSNSCSQRVSILLRVYNNLRRLRSSRRTHLCGASASGSQLGSRLCWVCLSGKRTSKFGSSRPSLTTQLRTFLRKRMFLLWTASEVESEFFSLSLSRHLNSSWLLTNPTIVQNWSRTKRSNCWVDVPIKICRLG